uniref:Uncharacterized protein n=1 Tax=Myoviridae sp. ctj3P51 TaxID=2826687 RepID=A0A8S5NR50_9CAUD|nr:MAG TPA: hypothetical protein [Myoviridae sp. ctj3P51]
MSNSTRYRKRYKAPIMSEPSDREKRFANRLMLLNVKLKGSGYEFVVDQDHQFRLVLTTEVMYNSAYYKDLYEKHIAEKHARKSASPDTENEDPFFTVLRKVHERSVYGMHTIYGPRQLTIDDVLNEHSNK